MNLDFLIKLSKVLFLILFGVYLIMMSSKESEKYWLSSINVRIKIFILALALIVSGIALAVTIFPNVFVYGL